MDQHFDLTDNAIKDVITRQLDEIFHDLFEEDPDGEIAAVYSKVETLFDAMISEATQLTVTAELQKRLIDTQAELITHLRSEIDRWVELEERASNAQWEDILRTNVSTDTDLEDDDDQETPSYSASDYWYIVAKNRGINDETLYVELTEDDSIVWTNDQDRATAFHKTEMPRYCFDPNTMEGRPAQIDLGLSD